jgi:carbonic anhydrase
MKIQSLLLIPAAFGTSACNTLSPDSWTMTRQSQSAATPAGGSDRSSKNAASVDKVAGQNVRRMIATIRKQSPILRGIKSAEETRIVGVMHDIGTGKATFLN